MAQQAVLSTTEPYVIREYDGDAGPATAKLSGMVYAADGYLYLGSSKGLVRADGVHFDLFTPENTPGLRSEQISQVYDLGGETLLIADYRDRLYRVSAGSARPLVNPETGDQIHSSLVRVTPDSLLLVIDPRQGYLVSRDTLQVIAPALPPFPVWDGLLASDRSLYLLGKRGLFRMTGMLYEKIPIPEPILPDLSEAGSLEQIGNRLFVMGRGSVTCWDLVREIPCSNIRWALPANVIPYHLSHSDGRYLLATSDGFYKEKEETLQPFGPRESIPAAIGTPLGDLIVTRQGVWKGDIPIYRPPSEIHHAVSDRDGGLWLSTSRDGLVQIRKHSFRNHIQPLLANSEAVVEDSESRLWVASRDHGILRQQREDAAFHTVFPGTLTAPDGPSPFLHRLPDGTIVAGNPGTLPFRFEGDRRIPFEELRPFFERRDPTPLLTGVAADRENDSWILGSTAGVYRLGSSGAEPLTDRTGQTLGEAHKIQRSPFRDELFLASETSGLVILHDSLIRYPSMRLPEADRPTRDFYLQSEDTVWTVARSSGLYRFIRRDNEDWEMGHLSGLPEESLHRIIRDHTGHFWISSESGLMRISEAGLRHSMDRGVLNAGFSWYGRDDGLASETFNGGTQHAGTVDRRGHIWFPHIRGITGFDPGRISPPSVDPGELKIQLITTPLRSEFLFSENPIRIKLGQDERDISLRIAHLHLSDNQTDRLWYRLSGRDTLWKQVGNGGWIRLNDLEDGVHHLELAQNPERPDPVLKRVILTVSARWYESALVTGPLLGLLLLLSLYWAKTNVNAWKQRDHSRMYPEKDPVGGAATEVRGPNKDERAVAIAERPAENTPPTYSDPIERIIRQQFLDPNLTIDTLTSELNISRSALYRTWNKEHAINISDYIIELRLKHALQLLEEGHLITEAAELSGFSSSSYFTKVFKKHYGMPPSRYLYENQPDFPGR